MQFNTRNGIITNPGKFEGEPVWVPYFWDCYLDGGAEHDDEHVLVFDVTDEDRAKFPGMLDDVAQVRLYESEIGFVHAETVARGKWLP